MMDCTCECNQMKCRQTLSRLISNQKVHSFARSTKRLVHSSLHRPRHNWSSPFLVSQTTGTSRNWVPGHEG